MNIKGKTALITGGAHRVGKAITLKLAEAGANVVINYHTSATQAEMTVREAQALGVQALALQCNIADKAQIQTMAEQIKTVFGELAVLVNNADRWEQSPFPSEDTSAWERIVDIAVHGTYYVSNALAPLLLAQESGAIVNIVDISAWEAWPNFTAHVVGKSAVLAMTRQFALELAPTVRVNAVVPGPVLPPPDYTPEKIAETADKTLLHRWGSAEDVAEAVKFLIEANYITGDTIFVDGGQRYGHRKYDHG